MMTPQQTETYILNLLRGQEQQNNNQLQQNTVLSQLQISLAALTTTVNSKGSGGGGSGAGVLDSYPVAGGVLHRLIHTFNAAVNFATTILVTGIATFTAAPVLSALTASLPLQLTAGKAITSALISLTSAVTGILPVANGGTGTTTLPVITNFSPTVTFGGAAVGITYSAQTGVSFKIGTMVVVLMHITLTSKGSSTGAAQIASLPTTVGANLGGGYLNYYNQLALIANPILIDADNGTTHASLYKGVAAGSSVLDDTNFTNSSELTLTLIYSA